MLLFLLCIPVIHLSVVLDAFLLIDKMTDQAMNNYCLPKADNTAVSKYENVIFS